ncbi:MAG: hypothetical protein ACOYXA_11545 [Bacteroidota bacterium]
MNKLKKYLRLLVLILLILAALCGLGMMPRNREQDVDNEIKTELEDETGREATNPD